MNATSRLVRDYHIALALITLLTGLYLIFVVWAYFEMPDQVPMHFDMEGNPDRVSSKNEFLIVNVGIGLLMYLCFGVFAVFLEKIPAKFWNLPNRDYWLAPERKTQTVAEVNVSYIWIGIVSILLLFHIAWGVYQTAIGETETLAVGLWEMGTYFVVMTALCVKLCVRFMRKPE